MEESVDPRTLLSSVNGTLLELRDALLTRPTFSSQSES